METTKPVNNILYIPSVIMNSGKSLSQTGDRPAARLNSFDHFCRHILYLYLTLVSLNTIVFFSLRQVKFLILKTAKSTSVQCIKQVSGEELFLPQATQLTMWCQLCYLLTSHRITGSSEVSHCSANWTTKAIAKAILVPRLFDDRSWWCWTDETSFCSTALVSISKSLR